MAFPIAISVFFLRAATTEVASSGRDVPMATMVNPIIVSLRPKLLAIILALSTLHFPPKNNAANPIKTYRISLNRLFSFFVISSFISSFLFSFFSRTIRII